MSTWTPMEWAGFLVALGTFVNTVLIGVATFLVKIKGDSNAKKIDDNTAMTKAGKEEAVLAAKEATSHAKEAAVTASDAKTAATKLSEQMNGSLDERITEIVKEHTEPLVTMFREHNDQDQQNMDKINATLKELASAQKKGSL